MTKRNHQPFPPGNLSARAPRTRERERFVSENFTWNATRRPITGLRLAAKSVTQAPNPGALFTSQSLVDLCKIRVALKFGGVTTVACDRSRARSGKAPAALASAARAEGYQVETAGDSVFVIGTDARGCFSESAGCCALSIWTRAPSISTHGFSETSAPKYPLRDTNSGIGQRRTLRRLVSARLGTIHTRSRGLRD